MLIFERKPIKVEQCFGDDILLGDLAEPVSDPKQSYQLHPPTITNLHRNFGISFEGLGKK